jgi:hypothetical protein
MRANFSLNGKTLLFDQKVDHDRTYSFMQEPYIVNVRLPSRQKKGTHLVEVRVDQKKDHTIKTVSTGKILSRTGKEVEMKSTDNKTQETFTYKFTIIEI